MEPVMSHPEILSLRITNANRNKAGNCFLRMILMFTVKRSIQGKWTFPVPIFESSKSTTVNAIENVVRKVT